MKILMVTADHLMIDRRILQEAKSLIEHGHEVTLLAGFECEKRESYVIDGIKVERFVFDWSDSRFARWARLFRLKPGTKLNDFAWKVFRYLAAQSGFSSFDQYIFDRLLEYQVDVMHVHDYPMLRAGVELARKRKVPLVYDAHELYYAQTQLPIATQELYKRREKKWIRYADRVITVNPFIAKLMAQRYRIKSPEVILNAAPLHECTSARPIRNRFNFGSATKIVLYQGWISDSRGIDRLVLAAKHFDEGTVLVIVGYGAFEESLRRIVKENNLENRVFFFGGVESNALHPITCDADLGIIPYFGVDDNNYFCSPNKLFEFAIAELPFLSNDLPFLREIIDRYGNGFIADLGNPVNIAAAINQVISNSEFLMALREGAVRAKQELNWKVEESKLLSIYKSL